MQPTLLEGIALQAHDEAYRAYAGKPRVQRRWIGTRQDFTFTQLILTLMPAALVPYLLSRPRPAI